MDSGKSWSNKNMPIYHMADLSYRLNSILKTTVQKSFTIIMKE